MGESSIKEPPSSKPPSWRWQPAQRPSQDITLWEKLGLLPHLGVSSWYTYTAPCMQSLYSKVRRWDQLTLTSTDTGWMSVVVLPMMVPPARMVWSAPFHICRNWGFRVCRKSTKTAVISSSLCNPLSDQSGLIECLQPSPHIAIWERNHGLMPAPARIVKVTIEVHF